MVSKSKNVRNINDFYNIAFFIKIKIYKATIKVKF